MKSLWAGLPSKISPAPTMFSAPVPLPAENFDDGSTEEPEHPNMKENPLKESAPFSEGTYLVFGQAFFSN
ncbi:hypothetical protein ZWY2020_034702 [Hordeum vulgare]|nr:hypothetical protein ZWY2020_034702 [Hordeum vulgare]